MAPVESPQVDTEAIPPSVSKQKLSGSSAGFISGRSTTVLRPRGSKSSPELPNSSSETVRMDRPKSANIICSIGQLSGALEQLHHCHGHPLTISENSSVRRGLVSRVTFSCQCGWFHHTTNPYNVDHLSVNARAVFASRMIGRSSASLDTLCAIFDFPGGLGGHSYGKYNSDLYDASNDAVLADQLACADELRVMHAAGRLFVPPRIDSKINTGDEPSGSGGDKPLEEAEQSDQSVSSDSESSCSDLGEDSDLDDPGSDMADFDASQGSHSDQDGSVDRVGAVRGDPSNIWTDEPLDVTVTFDGTWSKRGYTALYGVCVVMSWDTGRVLDTVVLSKCCSKWRLRGLRFCGNGRLVD